MGNVWTTDRCTAGQARNFSCVRVSHTSRSHKSKKQPPCNALWVGKHEAWRGFTRGRREERITGRRKVKEGSILSLADCIVCIVCRNHYVLPKRLNAPWTCMFIRVGISGKKGQIWGNDDCRRLKNSSVWAVRCNFRAIISFLCYLMRPRFPVVRQYSASQRLDWRIHLTQYLNPYLLSVWFKLTVTQRLTIYDLYMLFVSFFKPFHLRLSFYYTCSVVFPPHKHTQLHQQESCL